MSECEVCGARMKNGVAIQSTAHRNCREKKAGVGTKETEMEEETPRRWLIAPARRLCQVLGVVTGNSSCSTSPSVRQAATLDEIGATH